MTPPNFPTPRSCRLCAAAALSVLYDFGEQPVAGYLETTLEAARDASRFRNTIAICRECGMVQQAYDGAMKELIERVYANYQPTYSMSPVVRTYMSSFLDMALARAGGKIDHYLLEIGSNDGAVLAEVQRRGHRPIGLDPSGDPEAASRAGYEVIRDFFTEESANKLRSRFGPASLIISRHTLEHVFDPTDFVRGIAALLEPNGIAILEVPYLRLQLMNNQFQSMTFQHISFFTVVTIQAMVRNAGMELKDLVFCDMDGGSMIAFIGQRAAGAETKQTLGELITFERDSGLNRPEGLLGYFGAVDDQRAIIGPYLDGPRRVAAFGAGTKGQALLNMLELNRERVPFVIDDTPGTAGRFIPGTANEVVNLDDPRIEDTMLLLVTAPTHILEVVRRAQTRFPATLPILATAPAVHFVAPALH